MKILIAIPSCRQHQAYQQAQRETWLGDLPDYVDYAFFVGHKDGLSGDEYCIGKDKIVPEAGLKLYPTLPEKTKAICKWSDDHGYDVMFKCDTDTLVFPKRLLASGFEQHDYFGGYNHEETGEFCSGGAGYWLSRKAMQTIVNSSIESWAEDVFVALALKEKGILPVWHEGFQWQPHDPFDDKTITIHLPSVTQMKYDPSQMYSMYNDLKSLV